MNRIVALFLTAALVAGCATAPSNEDVNASGLRIATIAYITRGKTPEAQWQRAEQILQMAALVRTQIGADSATATDLDAVAALVNQRIQSSDLAPGDKQLAQALVIETILLAGNGMAQYPGVGSDTTDKILELLVQIERTAAVFAPAVG